LGVKVTVGVLVAGFVVDGMFVDVGVHVRVGGGGEVDFGTGFG
jgi:hypothetical protein